MSAGDAVMARKWEYRVTEPNLPLGAKSPVMDSQQTIDASSLAELLLHLESAASTLKRSLRTTPTRPRN
jgi:hypothetical protein